MTLNYVTRGGYFSGMSNSKSRERSKEYIYID
jgi:hypothetical protein